MPIARVKLPDGRVARVQVPDGTTPEQAVAIANRVVPQKGADNRPTSFWQGVGDEVRQAAHNLDSFVSTINPIDRVLHAVAPGTRLDPDAMRHRINAREQQAQDASPTRGSTAGNMAGGILATAPTMLIPGGPVVQGAVGGALLTHSKTPLGVARDIAIGGGGGKVGELAGKYVIAPIAERVGRTAPARFLAQQAVAAYNAAKAKAADLLPIPQTAPAQMLPLPQISRADAAMANSAPIATTRAELQQAADLRMPMTLADTNPQLAGSVVRYSPAGRQLAEQTLNARARGQAGRAVEAIDTHLAPVTNIEQRGKDIMAAGKLEYDPLYEQSYQGGSIAPLQSQLEQQFANSSKVVSDAAQELAAAQRGLTISKAGVSRAGDNVYANASALPADREAQVAVQAAQQKLAAAQAEHAQVTNIMRLAQNDAAANAPGAVWSPRVQQFLEDSIGKPGIARGLEIQRLENLAAGKPFNPTEYAITGADEAGNPIVGNVPNMRLLDAYKKGLDGIIADETDQVTGKMSERGRAVTMVKQALLSELDGLNPDYQAARGSYGRFAEQAGALKTGYNELPRSNVPQRQFNDTLASARAYDAALPPEAAAQATVPELQRGYATSMADTANRLRLSHNPYEAIYGGTDQQAKVGALFPEGAPTFNKIYDLESQMAGTRNKVLGNSLTQDKAIADQQFAGTVAPALLEGGVQLATGVPGAGVALAAARRLAAPTLADRWNMGLFGPKAKADELAPILFNPDTKAAIDYLDQLAQQQAEIEIRRRAYANAGGLFGRALGAAPAVGLLSP